jgi:hypothetical protein
MVRPISYPYDRLPPQFFYHSYWVPSAPCVQRGSCFGIDKTKFWRIIVAHFPYIVHHQSQAIVAGVVVQRSSIQFISGTLLAARRGSDGKSQACPVCLQGLGLGTNSEYVSGLTPITVLIGGQHRYQRHHDATMIPYYCQAYLRDRSLLSSSTATAVFSFLKSTSSLLIDSVAGGCRQYRPADTLQYAKSSKQKCTSTISQTRTYRSFSKIAT